jgi:hypothetical protein
MLMKNKKIILYCLYSFPALLVAFIGLNKIFPSETYSFESKKLDKATIILTKDNSFTITPQLDPKKIKIEIEYEPNSKEIEISDEIILKKGFAASFYPQKKSTAKDKIELGKYATKFYLLTETEKKLIPTLNILQSYGGETKAEEMTKTKFEKLTLSKELAGFLDGTLIQDQESIFIISDGKKIIIPSPEIFDQLKYNWEKVVRVEKKEARIHSNSPFPLTLTASHPNGTIFKDNLSENYYLVKNGELKILDYEEYNQSYSAIEPIELDRIDPKEKITFSLNKKGSCLIELSDLLKAEEGNAYHFKLPEAIQVSKIKVKFLRNISWENLKITARKFK